MYLQESGVYIGGDGVRLGQGEGEEYNTRQGRVSIWKGVFSHVAVMAFPSLGKIMFHFK